MNEGWIIVGLIIVGLVLLCLVLWVGKIILIGAGGLLDWASEQGFLGIAAYFACWVFLFPFMLIACAFYGFNERLIERQSMQELREDKRIATQSMQNFVAHQGRGLEGQEIQEVTQYSYQVHVVPSQEYVSVKLEDRFRGGVVVDGLGGFGDDYLIVTAHLDDGNLVTGLGRSEVQGVSKYSYQVHVVSARDYESVKLEEHFRGGVVVDGLAGMGNDCLIITAHRDDGNRVTGRRTSDGKDGAQEV